MSRKQQFDVLATAGAIASACAAMGLTFEIEADNRHGKRASRYVCVRKPFAAKIRVADHRSNWIERNGARSRALMLDVGPHALSAADAIAAVKERLCEHRS